MPNILLAVDLSYQTYRASAAHKDLKSLDQQFTGGLYGFLLTVAKLILETRATHVAICCDSKPYLRSLLYPEYKLLRANKKDPELYERFQASKPLVEAACRAIGLPLLAIPGYESDDLIGGLLAHRRRFAKIYAASNDSDLYQLCWWKEFYVMSESVIKSVDTRELWRRHGVTPEQHALMTALMGTHNDVEGIPNVGPKRAADAVRDPGLLRSYMERYGDLIRRNQKLIKLPYDGFPGSPWPAPTRSFHARDFYRFLAPFDITATQNMINSFSQVCP